MNRSTVAGRLRQIEQQYSAAPYSPISYSPTLAERDATLTPALRASLEKIMWTAINAAKAVIAPEMARIDAQSAARAYAALAARRTDVELKPRMRQACVLLSDAIEMATDTYYGGSVSKVAYRRYPAAMCVAHVSAALAHWQTADENYDDSVYRLIEPMIDM